MRLLFSTIALLAVVHQLPSGAFAAEQAESDPELSDILKAWRQRTEDCKSLRYDWTETRTEHTATFPQMSIFSPAFVQRQEFEDEYATHELQYALQLGPEGIWHRREGPQWSADTCRVLDSTAWTFHDGKEELRTVYIRPEATRILPELAPAIAFLGGRGSSRSFHVDPILLHHCPFEERFGPIDASSLQLDGERAEIDGHPCVRLTDGRYSYWVDEKSPFLIRRYERPRDEPAEPPYSFRADLTYHQNGDGVWALSGWSLQRYYVRGLDGPDMEATATVTEAELNEAVESMDHLMELPLGTQVMDRSGDKLAQYLVLEGGKRREITSDDTTHGSVTYQELRTSEPGQAMPEHFIEIRERLRGIGGTTPADRDAQLAELKIYLAAREPRLRHVDLLKVTARRLFRSDEPQAAIEMYRDIAEVSDVFSRVLLPLAEEYEGELRRAALPGSEIVLTGRTVEGAEFDWSSYRGKVVLVYFWFTGCQPCVEEMPQIAEVREEYRNAGFDVVGISSDASKETLSAFLAKEAIAWTNIHEPSAAAGSNARRYSIRAWPTAILVNRDGNVVSLKPASVSWRAC